METVKKTMANSEKAISLYKYIREISAIKRENITDVGRYELCRFLSDIPKDDDNITFGFSLDGDGEDRGILLKIKRPEFKRCPAPEEIFAEWLSDGWDDPEKEVIVAETRNKLPKKENRKSVQNDPSSDGFSINEPYIDPEPVLPERFGDNVERVSAFDSWKEKRDAWAEKYRKTEGTRKLFNDLYAAYTQMERRPDTLEIVAANGIVSDREDKGIKHPLILKRALISFDPSDNSVCIRDSSKECQIYSELFGAMRDIGPNSASMLKDMLENNPFHPFDSKKALSFLETACRIICPDSLFSNGPYKDDFRESARILMEANPCIIVRKRSDGTFETVEKIIENINETGYIPPFLSDIVGGGTIENNACDNEIPIDEILASAGGESLKVLLAKPANREQLDIAERIEKYNAALVQGPPGTGKTYSIANLIGHFLARGQSVLVTSHTKKALSVLKEKLPKEMQSLCVSVIDDDQKDMEKSIDGITEYMAIHTSTELEKEMTSLEKRRENIIALLSDKRKRLYEAITAANGPIKTIKGELTPSEAARFVFENSQALSYLGGITEASELPLSSSELNELYSSNGLISAEDEKEIGSGVLEIGNIASPEELKDMFELESGKSLEAADLLDEYGWLACVVPGEKRRVDFDCGFASFSVLLENKEALEEIKSIIASCCDVSKWMVAASCDGKKGGAYRQRWLMLAEQAKKTCALAEQAMVESFGKTVDLRFEDLSEAEKLVSSLKEHIEKNSGRISKITSVFVRSLPKAAKCVFIDGSPLGSKEDCDIALKYIALEEERRRCASYWDSLMAKNGEPSFSALDQNQPEEIAQKRISSIYRWLDWMHQDYERLKSASDSIGLPLEKVLGLNDEDPDFILSEKIFANIHSRLEPIVEICHRLAEAADDSKGASELRGRLAPYISKGSQICSELYGSVVQRDIEAYGKAYENYVALVTKKGIYQTRFELLSRLKAAAPAWAGKIEEREGIHGENTPPSNITNAWKWEQCRFEISKIVAMPYDGLQEDCARLSAEYRSATAEYACKSAWFHLLSHTEKNIDIKQALQGWKQTVKKIGKGTGKTAPMYRAEARKLMEKCQAAVPVWIMPMGKAMESLNPKTNRFDIIIIDEASQSDVTALAVLYMGRKVIVVGDDRQVSPSAVGVDSENMNRLIQLYIKDIIPNAHLYDTKTSVYDIAATTFPPLMLREHFRCVPDIIGFSNMLSYDYKIKPLRDGSDSLLLPPVIEYHVENGERGNGKTNRSEAMATIAVLLACMEQPEYSGKTYGIISLLGDEQAELVQNLLLRYVDISDIEKGRIICGSAADFQGDERDVIFLNMVDSGGEGPKNLVGFGAGDMYRKRYNVAVSRARDQLWVINSLNPETDLKEGDLRRTLLSYALNPGSYRGPEDSRKYSFSPLELSVGEMLKNKGFDVSMGWNAGAYILGVVVHAGTTRIAVEFDGDTHAPSLSRTVEDMERQAVLERIGWKFVRIRSAEYLSDPALGEEKLLSALRCFGASAAGSRNSKNEHSSLYQRVSERAKELLENMKYGQMPNGEHSPVIPKSPAVK